MPIHALQKNQFARGSQKVCRVEPIMTSRYKVICDKIKQRRRRKEGMHWCVSCTLNMNSVSFDSHRTYDNRDLTKAVKSSASHLITDSINLQGYNTLIEMRKHDNLLSRS